MGYDKVIHRHYEDLNNLNTLLRNYVDMYRLLVSSAAELNTVQLAKKSEIKDAVDRIHEIGELIDDLLKVIEKCEESYIKYCFLKNEVISENTEKESIKTEIHNELEYHN
ncbi:hypothetical protein NNC19_14380 [Clostridium sp. SHJSY1]|uniref:hypothetical protein n=1 Tax=Clostridium sp. SHJSY1 TaxID=2942483 RepID=UPI00287635E8|nr:hypothetical protein [Clostridium sp. SHJSY1]MDS0526875.1 hypothetical protein [Clostridium sp. SHJSY1]